MADFIVRWRRPRRVVLLPELNQYPVTPFTAEDFPAWKAVEAFSVDYEVTFQSPPKLNEYPATPTNTAEGYPAWEVVPPSREGVSFEVRLQLLPELDTYPVTPAGTAESFPAWQRVDANQIRFDIALQRVELDERPAPPPSVAILPAIIPPITFRIGFDRRFLTNDVLNRFPPAIVGVTVPGLPQIGEPYDFPPISLSDVAASNTFLLNPTIITGDFQISKDRGESVNLATLPVVSPIGSSLVHIALTKAEMTGVSKIGVTGIDSGGLWADVTLSLDVPRGNEETNYDIITGDETETSISTVVKRKGTSVVVKSKTIDGSLLPANVTVTTSEP